MGKKARQVGQLEPGRPLIVSLPNFYYGDRPDWQEVLKECEQKDIAANVRTMRSGISLPMRWHCPTTGIPCRCHYSKCWLAAPYLAHPE